MPATWVAGCSTSPSLAPQARRIPAPPTPRSGDAQAMATPELGAESTFWLRPVDPVPAPGTVRFDAGLQRAGQQPQHSGEAAMRGYGGASAFRSDPGGHARPQPPHLHTIMVTGCLRGRARPDSRACCPQGSIRSDAHEPMARAGPATRNSKPCATASGRFGLPTTRAIDSMIERLRAVEGGRGHIQLIQQLEALKESIDRVLTNVYGYRADADWLAKVDRVPEVRQCGASSGSRAGIRRESG